MRASWRRLAVALPLAVTVAASGAAVAGPHAGPQQTRSGVVTLRTTDDAGTCAATPTARKSATGAACPTFPLYYAMPKGTPRALVVVFHGHGHNGEQYPAQLASIAAEHHVIAVAMGTVELAADKPSYRGPFDSVDEEARDAAVAIAWARAKTHSQLKTYLLGVSMGGSGLAYFIDAATRAKAGDRDATWVQSFHPLPLAGLVDAEGISNLSETWAEASGFDKVAAAEIELETGGTPTTATAAYQARSLALLPTSEWKATGLPVVAVIHDVDDGLVPYNQTFEARAAVLAAGISLQGYDIVFKDSCDQAGQTTGTATITKAIPGFPTSTTEDALCLAGHANENDPTTPVMKAAMQALATMVNGNISGSETLINTSRP
ncbi:MAG: hypothetical protein QOK42_1344 [Frankiaceae bacterium]|nr:hypothetical protein [Frankiaceae bacterium]